MCEKPNKQENYIHDFDCTICSEGLISYPIFKILFICFFVYLFQFKINILHFLNPQFIYFSQFDCFAHEKMFKNTAIYYINLNVITTL